MTNAEAWFSIALRRRKPEGSLGRTAQDGHLDSHTAPELQALVYDIFLWSKMPESDARSVVLLASKAHRERGKKQESEKRQCCVTPPY